MSLNELIWFIFSDELVAAMIVPMHHKYALKSALLYNTNILLYLAAFFGSAIGLTLNFILARIIRNGLNLKFKLNERKKLIISYFLLLIPIDIFGSVASFLVAISGVKYRRYITISLVIYLIYYSYKLIVNF